MVLATGHIGIEEIRALVKAAKGAGVRRIVLTHPDLPSIAMPFDLQAELAKQGVLMERTYMINFSGKVTLDYTFAATRAAGVAGCFLSTDFGQPKSPWPDEGFGEFIQHFLDAGFTRDEVRTMVYDNPAGLVNE
jgi:predicted metal-dependent phosphotriesterase family hydrolase